MPHTRDELDMLYGRETAKDVLLQELDKLPSLFGGDGRTLNNPLIVNSESRAMAGRLMKNFVSKELGQFGRAWHMVESEIVISSSIDGYIERQVMEELDGRRTVFYFDLSRSHGGSLGLMRRAYEMRVLDEAEGWLVMQ